MLTGRVRMFDVTRGFGFIESAGRDYYVHKSNLNLPFDSRYLRKGDFVEFQVAPGKKGPCAVEVKRLATSSEFRT